MLKGKLTRVRPLELDDLEDLYTWFNDPDFSYWVSGGWPLVTMLRREAVEKELYEADQNRYALTDLNGLLIGTVGFDQVNLTARSARIFIGIGNKAYWSKGFGSDALQIFIRFLFNQWNFRRLTAETWQLNTRALACFQKLGFKLEGTLREAYYVDGQYYDGLLLGLLRKDFGA